MDELKVAGDGVVEVDAFRVSFHDMFGFWSHTAFGFPERFSSSSGGVVGWWGAV